ncbi:death ligand signal enhancer [Clarias gariepinus]|uniref:death ligand signal enhancer n=1 Tax=Clarias gariepinus TaxID=13013 RepID=UPI00234D0C40|nr:death ligand signal enhancer [Clarias gariepinus]
MWRVQSLVGRVLSRCHGNTSSLRLSNGHHVEDEVISSSSVLSSSRSQRGDDGEQKKNKKTAEFRSARMPRYTALDAVGWGAAAVLFMQICRRIHSQFSSVGEQNPRTACHQKLGLIPKCTHKILLEMLSGHVVLPPGVCVMGLKEALASPEQSSSNSSSSSSVYNYDALAEPGNLLFDQQEETNNHNITEAFSDFTVPQTAAVEREEPQGQTRFSLDEAEQNLRDVAGNSVPVILNIIGLESAKAGDHKAAFECFQASAQQNYSKAQFNIGVCYEMGHGVGKDLSKALQYYKRAALTGHPQAQYRWAKLLLNTRGQQRVKDKPAATATAISLLQSAAAAGLTEAQLYLGVLFSQDPHTDGGKSVHYFRMAANTGDSTGLLFLGQCYEIGFGVPLCYTTAVCYYEKAAAQGNLKAKNKLDLHKREVLRSIRSAPCLSVLDRLPLDSMLLPAPTTNRQTDSPTSPLPHSWSMGSLSALPPFTECRSGGWIIGMG